MDLQPDSLVPMDGFRDAAPISIDLVYAQAAHPRNIFKTALYADNARLWLHKDLAKIVLRAAWRLNEDFGWRLIVLDGLRPVEAQDRMFATDLVQSHPEWNTPDNGYLAPPGHGGHPRGMAVDVMVEGIDMGTMFDEMSPASARGYDQFPAPILNNRAHLESAMGEAAAALHLPLLPLPSEWWDFRFPKDVAYQYKPLRDADLPPFMRMTQNHDRAIPPDWQDRFDKTRADVLNAL